MVEARSQHLVKFEAPILITGPPHSGKSLLAKILGQDSKFHCFGEPLSLWNYGMNDATSDVRSGREATDEVIAEIRGEIEKTLLKSNKKRYLDEFSYHALRIPFVRKVLPEAKIVMMVRDPADVIPEMMYFWRYRDPVLNAWRRHKDTLSLSTLPGLARKFIVNYVAVRLRGQRKSWGPKVPAGGASDSGDLAERVAVQWETLTRIGLDDLDEHMRGQHMVVRFEDMVGNPNIVISEVAEFCEAGKSTEMCRFAARLLDPSYRFEKRDRIEPSKSRALDNSIRETRERLNYIYRESWF